MYRKECVVLESSFCTERIVVLERRPSLHCAQKGVVLERRPSLHCVQKGLCCFRGEAQSSLCTERTVMF